MDNLIRQDTVFGKRVNLVGNISADLVLESLGKVYIKSRNKALTLEELITSLVTSDPNASASRVKIVEGVEGLDTTEFKDGTFVFDKLSNILYIYVDNELLELINVAPEGTNYVKRTGDTMTGRLSIYVQHGPPLYVNSSNLVLNLNAQYLNGETAEHFTRRNKDEKINGRWTFRKPTTFESNTLFEKDAVLNGSIGSPNFASGFGGFGWRMDADTNTLTVDNLVVRKLMLVYELVVNKISATNGSLWVTNAGKVTEALKLEIKPLGFFDPQTEGYKRFVYKVKPGKAFIKLTTAITEESLLADAFSTASGENIQVKSCHSLATLRGAQIVIIQSEYKGNATQSYDLSTETFSDDTATNRYHIYPLFSEDFNFNCTFPIIARNSYRNSETSTIPGATGTGYMNYKDLEKECLELLIRLLNGDDLSNIPNPALSDPEAILALMDSEGVLDVELYVSYIKSYYKYFANGEYYYVKFDADELPVFKPGDILRCLKWTYSGIKYYDAVVCNVLDGAYTILLANSVLDLKTTITYNDALEPTYTIQEDNINMTLYELSRTNDSTNKNKDDALDDILLGIVEEKDALVLMGNLWDSTRQNGVYLTSVDDGAPYMDVLSGLNRPDYSVIYYVPIFKLIKLNLVPSVNKNFFPGFTHLIDIPYTGNYYIQEPKLDVKCQYVYFKNNADGKCYMATGKTLPLGDVTLLYYLNSSPNEDTMLGPNIISKFNILLELGGKIELESGEGTILLEQELGNLLEVVSTRTTKARLGNLDGILDEVFEVAKQPYGYGLYGLNVFLTGEFYLSNGQSVAEIGKEAIAFAIASKNAGDDAIALLRRDMERADNLIKLDVYTKGELDTAGMYIGNDSAGNPGIVMWGNKILLATTQAEFDGEEMPTALFANGKIQAKFIELLQLHSINNFYNNAALPTTHTPTLSTLRLEVMEGTHAYLTGENQVYFYKPITYVSGPDIEHSIYETHSTIIYIRKYSNSNFSCWIQCDIHGDPVLDNNDNPNYVTYKQFSSTAGSMYEPLNPSTMSDINNYDPEGEGDATKYNHYQEFLDYIAGNAVRLWSLHLDGRGNLGGDSFYWDTDGNVTIKGTIYASNGIIGGFYLNDNSLYIPRLSYTSDNTIIRSSYNPMLITSGNRNGNYLYTSWPSIQLTKEEYNYETTSFNLKSLVTIRPDVIQITDNTNDDGKVNRVILSSDGITWKKDGYELGVAGVLLNWVLIPIMDPDGRWAFYSRMSASGFNNWSSSNVFKKAFEVVYILWNSDGSMLMVFPNMTPAISDWFAENINQGKLTFLATGTNPGQDYRRVFQDLVPGTESTYKWETSLQRYANEDTYAINQSWGDVNRRDKIKVSIDAMVFASSDKPSNLAHKFGVTDLGGHNFRPDYEYFFKMTSYGFYDGTNGRPSQVSMDRNAIEIKSQNYMRITTSDDYTPNPGGVFLTIMYNNFSSVSYVSPNYGVIEDLPAGEESFSEQAAANKATYNGYATDLENRITVVETYYTANSISSSLLTTAKNALLTFKNAINNVDGQTGWINVANNSTVTNAHNSASTAVANLEEEYSQYQAKATHESQYLTVNNELTRLKNRIIENNLSDISSDEAQTAVTKYRTDIDETSTWKNNTTLDNDYTDATTKVNNLKTAIDTALSSNSQSGGDSGGSSGGDSGGSSGGESGGGSGSEGGNSGGESGTSGT